MSWICPDCKAERSDYDSEDVRVTKCHCGYERQEIAPENNHDTYSVKGATAQNTLDESIENTHPLWHVILFVGLLVIFFPWSLLLLILIFGWDGTVQLFRGIVIGTIGLAVFIIWVVVLLLITVTVLLLIFSPQ